MTREHPYLDRKHAAARARFTGDRKQCTICDEWFPLDKFYNEKDGLGGVRAGCKACQNKKRSGPNYGAGNVVLRRADERRREMTDTHKRCTKCRKWKWHHEFWPNSRGLGGLRADCKECGGKAQRRRMARIDPEVYGDRMRRSQEKRNERKRAEERERYKDCQRIINDLRPFFENWRGMQVFIGVDYRSLKGIASGEKKFAHRETWRKLKNAYIDFMEFKSLQFDAE